MTLELYVYVCPLTLGEITFLPWYRTRRRDRNQCLSVLFDRSSQPVK